MTEPLPIPRPDSHPSAGIFVGRQREMAALKSALDNAQTGQPRMVMLVGEAGIGKTSTAKEFTKFAAAQGSKVLWGRCYESIGMPPYWPWVQAIRSYVRDSDPEILRSVMGAGAGDIAEIVPEVMERLSGLEPSPRLDNPEQARVRLFDSITNFLERASRLQPLVLVLDNLHWADQPTLLLLEFLAQEFSNGQILVLGTYRDEEISAEHPLTRVLSELTKTPNFQRLPLKGLSLEDVGELITLMSGVTPPRDLVETVFTRTQGNLLFVTEVVRLLVQDSELLLDDRHRTADSDFGIPDGVREAISGRLVRLSDACNQALTTASVIGREFSLGQLERVHAGETDESLLELMEEGLNSRVIEEIPHAVGRYQFTHVMVQETLASTLSATRRSRMHGEIGRALESLYADDLASHAAELADHFSRSDAVLADEKFVGYSLMAGERSLAGHACEDAVGHFERGLVARGIDLSGTEAAADEEAAALLFGLARAKSTTGVVQQVTEAFTALSRAFEYYAEVGDVALAVATAEFPIAPPPNRISGVEMLARALTLVPADSIEAGRLLSRYGGILGAAKGDYEGAQVALGQAISIARREGDVPLEVQALTYSADVNWQYRHWQKSIDSGLRAIELATGNENSFFEVLSRWCIAGSLLHIGELDAARVHVSVLRELAERRSTSRILSTWCFIPICTLFCLEGDWESAREYSDRGLEFSPLAQQLLATRVISENESGESAQKEVYLERLIDAMRRRPELVGRTSMATTTVARATAATDRLALAESAAIANLSDPSVTPLFAMHAHAALGLMAVQRGDKSAASKHYSYLLGQRGTMLWAVTSVDRLLGLLSRCMGKTDQGVQHFEDALKFCGKAGFRPETAWVCHDYANMLLARDGKEDGGKAIVLLNESLAISTELGMLPLMKSSSEILERAESQTVEKPLFPNGLTQREVEVLRIVASGKTSAEIATDLVLSRRTVERHISNIYSKTGSGNRAEATAFAFIHGLMLSP